MSPAPQLVHPVGIDAVLHTLGYTRAAWAAELGLVLRTVERWAKEGRQPRPAQRAKVDPWLHTHGVLPQLFWASARTGDEMSEVTDLDAARRARGMPPITTTTTTRPQADEEPPMQITTREFLEEPELRRWQLTADPFEDITEDPEALWMSPELISIENALLSAIRRRQIVVLTGLPGAGKSSLIRRMYGRTSREKRVRLVSPAALNRTRVTDAVLATAIIRDITGQQTSSMAMERRSELLRTVLEDQSQAGVFVALVIDEAHHLSSAALLALKHLWDSHTLFKQLAVILVGHPQLAARLRSDPSIRELAGRSRLLEMPKLGHQVQEYLAWRFARVGGSAEAVFDASAFEALAVRGEHPLWTHNLAVLAMRLAFRVGAETVTAKHVASV